MAKLKHGLNGIVTGRIGKLVYYELDGEQIVRTIGVHSGEYTKAQLANQMRTKVVSKFLKPIKAFVGLSFKSEEFSAKNYAYNKATSYNKMNATQGEYPNIGMDYSKVRISDGNLPIAEGTEVTAVDGGLRFTWNYDEKADWARQEDQVMLMAYLPKQETALFIYSGPRRTEREATLNVPQSFLGEEIETYIAFISDDRTMISRSVYTGKLTYVSFKPLLMSDSFSSFQSGMLKQSTSQNKLGSLTSHKENGKLGLLSLSKGEWIDKGEKHEPDPPS